MRELSREMIKNLQSRYPKGTRVRFTGTMTDDPHPLPTGSTGTVIAVDDIGTIHVSWDNGRSLGLCYGHDSFEALHPKQELKGQEGGMQFG